MDAICVGFVIEIGDAHAKLVKIKVFHDHHELVTVPISINWLKMSIAINSNEPLSRNSLICGLCILFSLLFAQSQLSLTIVYMSVVLSGQYTSRHTLY